jgi:hypothetical protein
VKPFVTQDPAPSPGWAFVDFNACYRRLGEEKKRLIIKINTCFFSLARLLEVPINNLWLCDRKELRANEPLRFRLP